MKRGKNGHYIFTETEDDFLRKEYLNIPIKTIAKKWGCAGNVVRRRLKLLGLVIPKELAAQRMRDGEFKKGSEPVNKGKKLEEYMAPEGIENSKRTRFKKGRRPHNFLEGNGHVSIRRDSRTGISYKYLKLGDGHWMELHKHLWEEKHGKLPKQHCLIFKDGNQMNCTLENLELITQAENLRRNREAYLALPEEVKLAIGRLKKIKKAIKNGEQFR